MSDGGLREIQLLERCEAADHTRVSDRLGNQLLGDSFLLVTASFTENEDGHARRLLALRGRLQDDCQGVVEVREMQDHHTSSSQTLAHLRQCHQPLLQYKEHTESYVCGCKGTRIFDTRELIARYEKEIQKEIYLKKQLKLWGEHIYVNLGCKKRGGGHPGFPNLSKM